MRLWDANSFQLSDVVPRTQELYMTLNKVTDALKDASTSSSCCWSEANAIMTVSRNRVMGPVSASIRVVLLEDVHFLAAVANPLTPQASFSTLYPRAMRAFSKYLVHSSELFSQKNLEETTPQQRIDEFYSNLLVYISGTTSALVAGHNTYKAEANLAGFWHMAGGDIPLLQ